MSSETRKIESILLSELSIDEKVVIVDNTGNGCCCGKIIAIDHSTGDISVEVCDPCPNNEHGQIKILKAQEIFRGELVSILFQ